MKYRRLVLFFLAAPIMGLCSVCVGTTLPPVYVVDQFNGSSSINSWFIWWQNTPVTLAYDTVDAGGGPAGSGSLKVTADFSSNNGGFGIARTLNGVPWDTSVSISPTAYAYFSMDIRWDPGSVLDGNGTLPSYIVDGFDSTFAIQNPETVDASPSGNLDWVHVVLPMQEVSSGSELSGILFRMWGGDASGPLSINQPVTFWIDNVELTNSVPEPGSFALLLLGSLGLGAWRARKQING
jgi:hypothetical protein